MSQATNKEVGFSSRHFDLLQCLIPHRFAFRLNEVRLKIKTLLI